MSTDAVKTLTPQEWEFVNAVEQYFFLDGDIPTTERLSSLLGISKDRVVALYADSKIVEVLASRGINVDRTTDLLSAEQIAALAVFFDTKDGRSLKKKLNDIGVTTAQWDAWKREPLFQANLRQRAEGALTSNIAETEVALLDSAHRGDISAIKLHLEMAGRWSSKTVGELNVEFLLMKILEAVQKHVKDPVAIENIAAEIASLAPQRPGQVNSAGPESLSLAPVGDF